MFETIEKESRSSGGGGPQWMSSHPNPDPAMRRRRSADPASRCLVRPRNTRPSTAVAQNNPELKLAGEQQQLKISLRAALGTPLANASQLGGTS